MPEYVIGIDGVQDAKDFGSVSIETIYFHWLSSIFLGGLGSVCLLPLSNYDRHRNGLLWILLPVSLHLHNRHFENLFLMVKIESNLNKID